MKMEAQRQVDNPTEGKVQTTLDDLLSKLRGKFGYFQLGLCIFGFCVAICVSMGIALPIFILAIPDHRCALDGWENDTYSVQNSQHRQLINTSIPVDEDGKMSSCTIFSYNDVNGSSNDTRSKVPCDRWVYDKTLFERSLVGELDLVCNRKYLRTIGNALVHVALSVSAPFPGLISDRFGRKVSVTYCVTALTVATWCSGFIYDIPSLFIFLFVIGFGISQVQDCTFVLVVEVLEQRYRRPYTCCIYIMWAIGGFLILGVYSLVRNSQHLSFTVAASASLLLIALWFIPESPRWLLSKGRQSQAREVVLRIARINGVIFPENVFTEVASTFKFKVQNNERTANSSNTESSIRTRELQDNAIDTKRNMNEIFNLFTHKALCIRMLVLMFCMFTFSLVYWTVMYNLSSIYGSFYINFGLFNSLQIVGVLIAFCIMDKVGRSFSYLILTLLATIACLASVLPVFLATPVTTRIATNALGLVGILGIDGAYTVLILYQAELVPTLNRSMATSLVSISGRMGGIVGAFVADLGVVFGGRLEPAVPLLVSGIMLWIAFVSSWVLPETKGAHLPNTAQEAIMLKRNRRFSICHNGK